MSFKVETEFEHEGLKCVVIALDIGHRCGYVGINKNHRLYGVDYSDITSVLDKNKMQEIDIGNAGLGQMLSAMCGEYEKEEISPEMYFDVHGGITFTDGGVGSKYPIQSDLWWFGYDCAHCDDAKDLSLITNPQLLEIEMMYPSYKYGAIRTLDYCIDQCKKLAEQLVRV